MHAEREHNASLGCHSKPPGPAATACCCLVPLQVFDKRKDVSSLAPYKQQLEAIRWAHEALIRGLL
jgi:hypothetical protein